jgi:hypothetical protein
MMADTTAPAASESAAPAQPATASGILGAASPPPTEGIGEAPKGDMHAARLHAMAKALVDQGTLSPAQALEQLAAGDGAEGDEAGDAAQPNELTLAAEAVKASTELAGGLQSLHELPVDQNTATVYARTLERAMRNPPTPEQRQATRESTVRGLTAEHGAEGFERLLADANAEAEHLAATDLPNIYDWLSRSGGANDPHVVVTLAKRYGERMKSRALRGLKR